jgi:magnesium-transporting ATPase (P-type)
MSVIVGDQTLVLKGAFEVVLDASDRFLDDATGEVRPLTPEVRAELTQVQGEWSGGSNCYRCLGLAYKDAPDYANWDVNDPDKLKGNEQGLIWTGAAGIIDPHRDTVPPAITECKGAGIRVIMCTGDNPETATAIARRIGLLGENEDTKGKVFTGNQYAAMSQSQREWPPGTRLSLRGSNLSTSSSLSKSFKSRATSLR